MSARISVCGPDSRGRRARTIVNRKLRIRNRTRLSTAKRRLKKRKIVAVGMSQEAGDSASPWYLKSIPGSCHKPWTTVEFHDLPYFFILFPVFLPFLTALASRTQTRRHFRKTSTAKRKLCRISSELLLQNFRVHHDIRSEKSILLRNYDFEWVPRWLMFDGNNSFYSKLSTVLQAMGNTHYLIVSEV